MALLRFLGFGPAGIIAGLMRHFLGVIIAFEVVLTPVGSLAAAFQSFVYGGFTPAGGIFATLTSMAMLGTRMPLGVLVVSVFAMGVAVVVWKSG